MCCQSVCIAVVTDSVCAIYVCIHVQSGLAYWVSSVYYGCAWLGKSAATAFV